MNFKNKIVLITGASSGIGECLVYAFIKEGAKVILSARKIDDLERVKNNCADKKSNCFPFTLDLMKTENVDVFVKNIINKIGQIDILINNAGLSQRSLISETNLEIDRKLMEVNYFGTIALTKAVLPYMLKNKNGHILATSSLVGKFGFPLRASYSASKHALHGFFETLLAENYHNNIKVSLIIIGRAKTNISFNSITKTGEAYKKMDDGQEKGILPEKVAEIILKGIKKNKKEINIGSFEELLLLFLKRFFPFITYKIIRNIKAT